MNKMLKKVMLFGVLLSIGLIGSVSAKEVKFGSSNKDGNTLKVNAIMSLGSGETATNVTLKCGDTGNLDVSCKITTSVKNVTVTPTEGGKFLFRKLDNTSFANEDVLTTIILTNSSSSNASGTFTLEYSIDGAEGDKSVNYTIGTPKVVSTDASIKDMSVSQGTIAPLWSKDSFEYTIYNIADTINTIKFNHTCNAGACTVKYEGGKSVSGNNVSLNQGENNITLKVTAEDGKTTATYTFTVYRGESAFNSAKLSSLAIGTNKLDPEFDPNTKEYTVSVAYAVADLKELLQYELQDPKATATVKGLENLVVGENTVTIEVTNAMGDQTVTYTIKVTRMDDDKIEVLKYKDGDVTYKDAKGEEHTVPLSEFKNAYPTEYKKIVNKVYKFDEEGNIIPEDEEDSSSKGLSKTTLLIILIVVGLAAIGASGYFIFRKPKPKTDKKDKKDKKKKKTTDEEEEEVEEPKELGEDFSDDEDTTVNIDVALNDLMNTKQYEFEEEPKEKKKEE